MKSRFYLNDFLTLRQQPLQINTGNKMCVCPECNKAHLSVCTNDIYRDPNKAGLFHCFTPGCSFNGRLADEHFRTYRKEQGGLRPEFYEHIKTDNLSLMDYDPHSADPAQKMVKAYLNEQRISDEAALLAGVKVVANYNCSGREKKNISGPCLCYVNSLYGDIINIKYRSMLGKAFSQSKREGLLHGAPYHIDCLNPLRLQQDTVETLLLTEGEKDVLSLLTCGYRHVISVPDGASSKPKETFEAFLEWLKPVQRVLIVGDNDYEGAEMKKAYSQFFSELGLPVAVAELPMRCKDISDVLKFYGPEEVTTCISTASYPSDRDIIHIRDRKEDILNECAGLGDSGYSLGFGPYTDEHLRLDSQGGLIIITGTPNSGKTDWLRCTLLKLIIEQQKNVCMMSFEEPNKAKQIVRFLRILEETNRLDTIPKEQLLADLNLLDQHLTNINCHMGQPTPAYITGLVDRTGMRCDFLVVDPYLYLEPDSTQKYISETEAIKSILGHFQQWGQKHHTWVIIVAHPRKPTSTDTPGEYEQLTSYMISGSAHWANMGDFVLAVRRCFLDTSNADKGSANPSYTRVDVLKVRDQDLCNTGRIYYTRKPYGLYQEHANETAATSHILNSTIITQHPHQ